MSQVEGSNEASLERREISALQWANTLMVAVFAINSKTFMIFMARNYSSRKAEFLQGILFLEFVIRNLDLDSS